MRAYTVHAPPGDAAPDRVAFVKDGFSWPALFFAVPWMLWHRMWLTLMGYVIAWLLLAWTMRLTNSDAATVLGFLGAIFFAMEANNFRRWSLAGRGWRELGGAHGDRLEEAEIRFFSAWGKTPEDAPAKPAETNSARRRDPTWSDEAGRADHDGPIFGLFPEPER
jgi:hypothetical protein